MIPIQVEFSSSLIICRVKMATVKLPFIPMQTKKTLNQYHLQDNGSRIVNRSFDALQAMGRCSKKGVSNVDEYTSRSWVEMRGTFLFDFGIVENLTALLEI